MRVHAYLMTKRRLYREGGPTWASACSAFASARRCWRTSSGRRSIRRGKRRIGWYGGVADRRSDDDPCMVELSVDGRNAAQVFQWHLAIFLIQLRGRCGSRRGVIIAPTPVITTLQVVPTFYLCSLCTSMAFPPSGSFRFFHPGCSCQRRLQIPASAPTVSKELPQIINK